MMNKNDNTTNESGKGSASDKVYDEVAAAAEELKAAQAKLDAAKARQKAQAEAAAKTGAAVAVGDTPIELKAEPVSAATASAQPASEPNWTPYTPDPSGSQAAAGHATQGTHQVSGSNPGATPPPDPYVQQPYYTTYNTVPPQTPQPQQQYYYQQPVQPMVATKDHVAAGLLGIFLGWLGIHKFYLGYNTAGFIMLAVAILGSVLTLGLAGAVIGLIGFIEGIIYLVKSQSEFEQLYVFNKREWF